MTIILYLLPLNYAACVGLCYFNYCAGILLECLEDQQNHVLIPVHPLLKVITSF